MNIELTISAAIRKVSVRTKEKDDVIRRICKVTFSREFDELLAAKLGGDALAAREALEGGGISDVTLPLDSITAKGKLVCGTQTVEIPLLRGLKAKAKAGDIDDESPPSVQLEFEFDFHSDSWLFLGRNCNAWAEVTFTTVQPELPHMSGKGAGARVGA